jgi:RNA polymerase sigma-70 factor (ECF subfamily)
MGNALAKDDGVVIAFPGGQALDLGRLFDEHGAYVRRVALRLTGSTAAADDLTQEVFLTAWRRRETLDVRLGIRTWLYRVALNLSRHHHRSGARAQRLADAYAVEAPQATLAGPDVPLERQRQAALVQRAVLTLSDKLREVFVLYELEELEGQEVSEILDLPLNTVWSRLRLARAAFRDSLRELQRGEVP